MHQSLKKCKFIFGVRTMSWILEKVLKFAQQFSRPGKSLVNGDKEKSIFLLFLGPLLVTYFNNLESGKKLFFWKKVLIFGSKNQFTNPDFKSDVLAAVAIVDGKAPSYGWTGVCSINQVIEMLYSNVAANYIILEWGLFWKLIISKLLSIT